MPPKSFQHYRIKIEVFKKWWGERDYQIIPDEADLYLEGKRKVPSWRRICKSLLRNDYWCKGLSFTQQKSEVYGKYLAHKSKLLSMGSEISPESIQASQHSP